MAVAQRYRQRVAGVDLHLALDSQQYFDHVLNLSLVGIALADQSLFDLAGGVFVYRQIQVHRRANCRAARLPKLQGRIGVLMHENLFDAHLLWLIKRDDFTDSVENLLQPARKVVGKHTDAATGNIANTARCGLYHTVTGDPGAGIYAEYPDQ